MAIGSVAVVASAEETAAATTQVKTKADLEAYVKSFDGFRAKEINDYGSISGENFLDALEYAENVIDDAESTVDDYTAAYQMITATYNALKVYTAEELSALIKTNKAKYESNNIYNDDLGDAIYANDKGQWDKFVTAYEDAEAVLESKDGRIISDAYETLTETVENLSPLTTVTKAQFRTALKNYETLKQNVYKYDTWRRGSMTADWTNIPSGNFWGFQGKDYSFGALYSWATANEQTFYDAYDKLDANKTVSKTSLDDIVAGFVAVGDVNALLEAWKPDDTDRSSKAAVKGLINQYRGALVYCFNKAEANLLVAELNDKGVNYVLNDGKVASMANPEIDGNFTVDYNTIIHMDPESNVHDDQVKFHKITDASIKVKANENFYIPVDKEGLWTGNAVSKSAVARDAYPTGVENYKLIAKGSTIDLTDYIKVTAADLYDNGTAAATAEGEKVTPTDEVKKALDKDVAAVEGAIGANDAANVIKTAEAAVEKANDADVNAAFAAYKAAAAKADEAVKALAEALKALSKSKDSETTAALAEKIDEALAAIAPVAYWDGITPGDAWTDLFNAVDAYDNKAAGAVTGDSLKGDMNIWWLGQQYGKIVDAAKTLVDNVEYLSNAQAKDEQDAIDAYNNRFSAYGVTKLNNMNRNGVIDAVDEYVAPIWAQQSATGVVYFKVKQSKDNVIASKLGDVDKKIPNVDVDLGRAMEIAELYIEGNKDLIADVNVNALYRINTTDEVANGSARGSAAEWTMVYRYLKYALSDKFDLVVPKYTKAQVVDLLEKSYDLAEKTGDAALFSYNHQKLVDNRKLASEWVAAANKDKKYRDNISAPNGMTATEIYNRLNNAYTELEKDYNAFKYSFGEIYAALASYSEMLDEGELTATDALKAAMEDTAYRLSIVGNIDDDLNQRPYLDNEAFTSDRLFLDYNRVYTSTDTGNPYKLKVSETDTIEVPKANSTKATKSHYALMKAYEALVAEVKAQTEKTTLLGDVNGDGVVNALDAAAILKAVVSNTAIEVAVGDFNADGAVNALDAAAILKDVVSKA